MLFYYLCLDDEICAVLEGRYTDIIKKEVRPAYDENEKEEKPELKVIGKTEELNVKTDDQNKNI